MKLQKSAKYSHFRILLKTTKMLGINSIPVRVTIMQSHRWLKIAVCGFSFFSKMPSAPCQPLIFKISGLDCGLLFARPQGVYSLRLLFTYIERLIVSSSASSSASSISTASSLSAVSWLFPIDSLLKDRTLVIASQFLVLTYWNIKSGFDSNALIAGNSQYQSNIIL